MIRAVLLTLIMSFLAFNAGRTYEYSLNVQSRQVNEEISRISFVLQELPVRGMK